MSKKIHPKPKPKPNPKPRPRPKKFKTIEDQLTLILTKLDQVIAKENIMAPEIDDLNKAVADIAAEVPVVAQTIADLRAAIAAAQNGMVPAADVEAAATALETSVANLNAAIAPPPTP
jgi:uncharacterized protein YoxC